MLQHKPLLFLPRNVVDVFNYTKLLSKIFGVPEPTVQVGNLPDGIMGAYIPPNRIFYWTNPTYEITVWHEMLHYAGYQHKGDPVYYIQEIYFMSQRSWLDKLLCRKKKLEHFHNYCGFCSDINFMDLKEMKDN